LMESPALTLLRVAFLEHGPVLPWGLVCFYPRWGYPVLLTLHGGGPAKRWRSPALYSLGVLAEPYTVVSVGLFNQRDVQFLGSSRLDEVLAGLGDPAKALVSMRVHADAHAHTD
jgi:hypothetical protein